MILFIHINAKTVTVLILNQPGLSRWSLINTPSVISPVLF